MRECEESDTLLDEMAEEFADRLRAGEHPLVTDYIARHPDRADEIRDVLSAVAMMERMKPRPSDTPERPGTGSNTMKLAGPIGQPSRVGEFLIERELGRGG